MFDYLQKFNNLPADIRQKVSTPEVMGAIGDIEKKFSISLAAVIIKVMIKELTLSNLAKYFIIEFRIDRIKAEKLVAEMKQRIFLNVSEYLSEPKRLENIKPEKINSGSGFFFSPEDEEEIRELSKKMNDFDKLNLDRDKINIKIEKIIKKTQIKFSSEVLINRFKQTITTYIKGIRDRLETKQCLKRPFQEGGLGFDEESADKVLIIVDEINNSKDIKKFGNKQTIENKQVPQKNGKEALNIGLRDIDYKFEKSSLASKGASADKNKKKKPEKLDTAHELAPPPPVVFQTPVKKPDIKKEAVGVKARKNKNIIIPKIEENEILENQEIRIKSKLNFRRPGEVASKKRMEDVKYIPKVMNPIDELMYMDLISFRRLAPNLEQRTEKIKDKIDLLEEEQYGKKIEGIKAWRKSSVNNLYLKIGQQSLGQKQSIDAIIEERKSQNKDCLTKEEFKAVMDLNKSLRF